MVRHEKKSIGFFGSSGGQKVDESKLYAQAAPGMFVTRVRLVRQLSHSQTRLDARYSAKRDGGGGGTHIFAEEASGFSSKSNYEKEGR